MNNIISSHLTQFREWLKNNQLDAFIIPHEDEFLGEYLPKHNQRLQWISGFTGSAGLAIITQTKAAIFVDGRYTVQVTKQAPSEYFEYHHLIDEPFLDWLIAHSEPGSKVGIDPRLHKASWYPIAKETVAPTIELVCTTTPIDELWTDRPAQDLSDITLMPLEYAGMTSETKRHQIGQTLKDNHADCAIITQLDSICWLLNIRGLDVSRFPVVLSHLIIYADGHCDFFVDQDRLPANFSDHVGSGVNVVAPEHLNSQLTKLAGKHVQIDLSTSNAWFDITLKANNATLIDKADPCALPKAQKNEHESNGMIACHVRDGAAMSNFLCWLDEQVIQNDLPDEGMASDKLEWFRRQDPTLIDLSFDTISAAGSNAAMCHYNHNNQNTKTQLAMNSFYLVDSGGHYRDGTTDITRTIPIGEPTAEMKKLFTLVLKGHIALATAKYPRGTTGSQLDTLARQFLWAEGYDFDHGTGHGVGHCLSVHEGPQRISKVPNTVALEPGMVTSNEPGYYRENQFGIRIENLELVSSVPSNGDLELLGFTTLTRCPIDMRALDLSLLTRTEIEWLNHYHQQVWDDVSPLLDEHTRQWLKSATAAITV